MNTLTVSSLAIYVLAPRKIHVIFMVLIQLLRQAVISLFGKRAVAYGTGTYDQDDSDTYQNEEDVVVEDNRWVQVSEGAYEVGGGAHSQGELLVIEEGGEGLEEGST